MKIGNPMKAVKTAGTKTAAKIGAAVSRASAKAEEEYFVGVIFSCTPEPAISKTAAAMKEVLEPQGYRVQILYSGNNQAREERLLKALLLKKAEGIIIEPSKSQMLCRHMPVYHRLEAAKVPFIFMKSTYPQTVEKPKLIIDDSVGGYLLTRHLIATGRRKIVGIFKADDNRGYERHRGYVSALQEAGFFYDPGLVIWYHSEDRHKKPVLALDQLLKTQKDVDAIVCYNDAMAASIIYHLVSEGKRVPEDLAVTGYGNSASADSLQMGLTSVQQPEEQLGKSAALLLLEKIRGIPEEESEVARFLKPELVIRGSSVAAEK